MKLKGSYRRVCFYHITGVLKYWKIINIILFINSNNNQFNKERQLTNVSHFLKFANYTNLHKSEINSPSNNNDGITSYLI